jgi:hypothetical protein
MSIEGLFETVKPLKKKKDCRRDWIVHRAKVSVVIDGVNLYGRKKLWLSHSMT